MRRYSVARARQNLAEVLDRAEQGEKVVIERRGVRFAVHAVDETVPKKRAPRRPRIEILDAAIESGNWTWVYGRSGLEFKPRKTKTRKSDKPKQRTPKRKP